MGKRGIERDLPQTATLFPVFFASGLTAETNEVLTRRVARAKVVESVAFIVNV